MCGEEVIEPKDSMTSSYSFEVHIRDYQNVNHGNVEILLLKVSQLMYGNIYARIIFTLKCAQHHGVVDLH